MSIATQQMLQLPNALTRRGVSVFVVDGWASRGYLRRPLAQRISGAICHWIVSTRRAGVSRQTLGLIINGHGTLPGPLANLYMDWDGSVGVVAAGVANHGGVGSWRGVAGNQNWVGIEAEGGPAFTAEQVREYPKVLAAIYDVTGRHPRDWAISHQEYAPGRKVDIGAYIHQIRTEAVRLVDNEIFAGDQPAVVEEPDMMSRLMRAAGDPRVYLVQGTSRVHVPNEHRLKDLQHLDGEARFLNARDVRVVSPEVLAMFRDVTP